MSLDTQPLKQLKIAVVKREPLRKTTNAIRLVNGKGDGLDGLVLEQYDKHFLVQIFDSRWLNQMDILKDLLIQKFKVQYFVIKDRSKSSSSNADAIKSHVLIENKPSKIVIKENNIFFEVDLNDGLNTGLFLDMRANRLLVGQQCKDKRVLNCFSYTCSFGVYARALGAKEAVNVDISNKVLNKGRHNYELNNLKEIKGDFIKADALKYLQIAVKKDNRFDVIILDPPSFARIEGKVFNVEKALPVLIGNALKVLNEGGKIFVSTNFNEISHGKLEQMFRDLNKIKSFKRITRLGQDKDFVGSGLMKESYLAALWVEVK